MRIEINVAVINGGDGVGPLAKRRVIERSFASALEGSLRVPCMIKWPGKIPSRASNEMVSNWRSQAYELIDPTRFSWFRGVAGQYSFTDCW
jgi:hypothetical protein